MDRFEFERLIIITVWMRILQYLKEAGWADGGRVIACTQPRRLAVQVIC